MNPLTIYSAHQVDLDHMFTGHNSLFVINSASEYLETRCLNDAVPAFHITRDVIPMLESLPYIKKGMFAVPGSNGVEELFYHEKMFQQLEKHSAVHNVVKLNPPANKYKVTTLQCVDCYNVNSEELANCMALFASTFDIETKLTKLQFCYVKKVLLEVSVEECLRVLPMFATFTRNVLEDTATGNVIKYSGVPLILMYALSEAVRTETELVILSI